MKQKIDVDALVHQGEFIQSNVRHTALVGGYGSGKSFAGVLKTLLKKNTIREKCSSCLLLTNIRTYYRCSLS